MEYPTCHLYFLCTHSPKNLCVYKGNSSNKSKARLCSNGAGRLRRLTLGLWQLKLFSRLPGWATCRCWFLDSFLFTVKNLDFQKSRFIALDFIARSASSWPEKLAPVAKKLMRSTCSKSIKKSKENVVKSAAGRMVMFEGRSMRIHM